MSKCFMLFVPLLLVFSPLTQADVLKCLGMYSNGSPMHVIYDQSLNTLNIDGFNHGIQTATDVKNDLTTQVFENDDGNTVYISIINSNKDIYLKVIEPQKEGNAKLIDTVHLACIKQ